MFRLETNLGGVDEAGAISPDLDWVGMVAAEFPAQRVRVRSLHPEGLEGARASYVVVRLEIQGRSVFTAEVHAKRAGTWAIYEDSSA
jgi:hypothetical protein